MTVYAVMVGKKFWCTYTEDSERYLQIATPGMAGRIVLSFPDFSSAWRFGVKKMDDEYGNKFQVVEIVQDVIDVDVTQEVAERPKRKKKRTKRKVRLAVAHG